MLSIIIVINWNITNMDLKTFIEKVLMHF